MQRAHELVQALSIQLPDLGSRRRARRVAPAPSRPSRSCTSRFAYTPTMSDDNTDKRSLSSYGDEEQLVSLDEARNLR